jgi:hypothetical protein
LNHFHRTSPDEILDIQDYLADIYIGESLEADSNLFLWAYSIVTLYGLTLNAAFIQEYLNVSCRSDTVEVIVIPK